MNKDLTLNTDNQNIIKKLFEEATTIDKLYEGLLSKNFLSNKDDLSKVIIKSHIHQDFDFGERNHFSKDHILSFALRQHNWELAKNITKQFPSLIKSPSIAESILSASGILTKEWEQTPLEILNQLIRNAVGKENFSKWSEETKELFRVLNPDVFYQPNVFYQSPPKGEEVTGTRDISAAKATHLSIS